MKDRNRGLDYIKGLAIIGVVLIHSTQRISGINYYLSTISHLGQLGCQMFFTVSGYLAIKSFKRCDSTLTFLAKKVKAFTSAWHIMLCFYCVYSLINFYILGFQSGIKTNTELVGILFNALFLSGLSGKYCNSVIPAGWFIGTLMLMYLCVPVVYSTIKDPTSGWGYFKYIFFCWMGLILWAAVTSNVNIVDSNTFGYYSLLNQFPCFIIGFYWEANEDKLMEIQQPKLFAVLFLGIIGVFILFYSHIPFGCMIMTTIMGIVTVALGSLIKKWECNLPLKDVIERVGQQSLYIYLTHILCVWYFPYYIQLLLTHLQININGTVLWAVLFVFEIPLMMFFSKFLRYASETLGLRLVEGKNSL